MQLHVQVLGFHIYPLSHTNLSIKSSLHAHLHLFSFHSCLLVKRHLQLSCHVIFHVSFILANILKTLRFVSLTISGTYNFAIGSLILLQLPLHLFILILNG